jgi:hypothetical protein
VSLSLAGHTRRRRLESVGPVDTLGQPMLALRESVHTNIDVHATVPLLLVRWYRSRLEIGVPTEKENT